MPNFVMYSLFMNDADRRLQERLELLTDKYIPEGSEMRWIFGVGDSQDLTEQIVLEYAFSHPEKEIRVVNCTTGLSARNPQERVRRKSLATNFVLNEIKPEDDYVIHHESDLLSPPDLIERFYGSGYCPVAGAVWLARGNGHRCFYDTWGYRYNGQLFKNDPPYADCWKDNELFEVESAGSCLMYHAEDVLAGLRCYSYDIVELCRKLKVDHGRSIWVDPTIEIVQPSDLFVPYSHA